MVDGDLFSYSFWRDAVERAIKSAAQALVGLFAATQVFNVFEVTSEQWLAYLSTALVAAGLSLLTSIGSNAVTGTASADSRTAAAISVAPGPPPPAAG